MHLSESQSEPSLVIAKVNSTKGTREKSIFLRTFVGRLAVSRSASMRRLTNFSSREQTLVRAIVPFSPDRFSFFYYYYLFYYFSFFFSFLLAKAIFLRSQPLGPLSPFPSPVRSEPTRSSRNESSLPSLLYTLTNRNTPPESSPPCVWRQSWIKYYFENIARFLFCPRPRRRLQHVLLPVHPSVQPPRSFPLLHPRLGDRRRRLPRRTWILCKAESARPLRTTLNQSSDVRQYVNYLLLTKPR